MTPAGNAAELRATVRPGRWRPTIDFSVDGVDLLELEHPLSWRGEPLTFHPSSDPRWLLPPDSFVLVPTAAPQRAMVGVCSCGEPGCNSLWLQVRREGGRVVWEPDPDPPRHSITRRWSFELQAYLDVLDGAVRRNAALEPRARRVARRIRRERAALFGFPVSNRTTVFECLGAESICWDPDAGPQLGLRLAGPDGDWTYLVPLPDERTDAEIIDSLHCFEPERFTRTAGGPWSIPNRDAPRDGEDEDSG